MNAVSTRLARIPEGREYNQYTLQQRGFRRVLLLKEKYSTWYSTTAQKRVMLMQQCVMFMPQSAIGVGTFFISRGLRCVTRQRTAQRSIHLSHAVCGLIYTAVVGGTNRVLRFQPQLFKHTWKRRNPRTTCCCAWYPDSGWYVERSRSKT